MYFLPKKRRRYYWSKLYIDMCELNNRIIYFETEKVAHKIDFDW
jgi:hypothetical protein